MFYFIFLHALALLGAPFLDFLAVQNSIKCIKVTCNGQGQAVQNRI